MFAKLKSPVFIDAFQLQLSSPKGNRLRGVLKDDQGSICSILERNIASGQKDIHWTGLNELPYGRYTLELSQGEDKMKIQLVKRV